MPNTEHDFAQALADRSKATADARLTAIEQLTIDYNTNPHKIEPILVPLAKDLIDLLADKHSKDVAQKAEQLLDTLATKASPHATAALMPAILDEQSNKPASNLGRAKLLEKLASANPAQMRRLLTDAIPALTTLMWDTKPAVKDAAQAAMVAVSSTVANRDIGDFIPEIVACIRAPETTAETIHKLAGVVFVQEIDGSALALMAPLLKRGFDEPTTSIKRNAARIVENMAKLVDDPYEVAPFVPLLLPALARAKDEVSDPECRDRKSVV